MYTHIFNKKQKLAFLFFLTCGMTITLLGLPLFNSFLYTNNYEESNVIESDNHILPPKTMEYQNYEGSGELINVTLHQSIVDTTTKQFSDLDVSNSFTEPFPNFTGYSSSFINMTAANIGAPNKTLIVEDDLAIEVIGAVYYNYISFESRGVGYLENISLHIRETNAPDTTNLNIYLFNATNDNGNPRPDTSIATVVSGEEITSTTFYWHKMTDLHTLIDCTKTFSNTFFLNLEKSGLPSTDIAINGTFDTVIGDNSDESIVLNNTRHIHKVGGIAVDAGLIVDLAPLDNTPKPSDVNLTINSVNVDDDASGSNFGYWVPANSFSTIYENISFAINADWWEVSCNITSVQINYTKTDVQAISSYDIPGSGQDVQWNVTATSGLNYFDSRITDFNVINFTIPRIWHESSIKVFNGSTEKTIFKRLINNAYREIQILNAGNGTYWFLNATSSNLLSSIDTFVSGLTLNRVNHSNIVRFNTTFSEMIYDGMLNLSVFTPSQGYLNHTRNLNLTSLGTDNEFTVSDWDVSVNVTEYGVFKIQMSWNNDTAAGFLEDFITVIADTDLTLSVPKFTFDSGDVFNMTVFYNDVGLSSGVQADDIYYQIGAWPIRRDNIVYNENGYYNITINCNDANFNYGPNLISVNVEKTYHNNQTKSEIITILAETDAYIVYPGNGRVFDSGDTFDLMIYYNDTVQDAGIAGANIEYSLNGGTSYRTGHFYTPPGQYNITISADDSDFNGYGVKQIIVNISKLYYYNHSETINIKILGETSLSGARIPDQTYYTAAETFSISVYYRDIVEGLGITGATVEIDVDGDDSYNPSLSDNTDGYYNITIDCSHSIFDNYGWFAIRINVSLVNYYNQTTTFNTLIVGNESLTVLTPNSGAVYIAGQRFDIAIEYVDTILSTGIDGATIEYSLNGGATFNSSGVTALGSGSGQYNVSIYVSDANFTSFGFVDIIISAYKQHYENRSTTYNFHRQITTQVTPFDIYDLGSVMKGLNVSYTFNYSDTTGKPIQDVLWSRLSTPVGFTAFLENLGNGNYTMHLDTTNVNTGSDFDYEFNVYATGNETQIIRLRVDVLIIQTEVTDVFSIDEIARNSGLNQSVRFYFNDTTNNLPVLNVLTSNIVVKNFATGTPFNVGEFWLFDPFNNGTYILNITMGARNSGLYTLEVNVSRFPNYGETLFNVSFYYRGNYTDINLISLSYSGGPPIPEDPTGFHNYTIFEGSDLTIEFNITDSEFDYNLIIGDADLYIVRYTNLGTGANGFLVTSLNFITFLHTGTIETSNSALTVGRYLLNLTTSRTNYEDAWFTFNLTIVAKYQTNLTLVFVPTQINTGDELTIIFRAEYYNGTEWFPIIGGSIRMTPSTGLIQTDVTNGTGEVKFTMIIGNIRTINITIELLVEYNYLSDTYIIPDSLITVIPPTPPLTFEDLLPYIIMIGAVAVVVVASIATYKGVIVPKKKEKQRILSEVKTIFDDAINLEHILVLYKGTGTCIFFKSYGSDQIDPELIGGFLSAVSSFGKEMATQAALNQISYGDKMLLLADGYLIRVALVLGKNASMILRRHLKKFIETFEKTYNDVLPNWRGQLNYFRNAGLIVDDLLNTSIILPHQISYDFASVKDLKNPHSKDVLKVAQSCCQEAEREFFFIATLLKDASEMTNKDTAEIFMGIKELRDKKLLIPIEISAIEAQPISQQELNLINQKVVALTSLTNEEKQKLVQDLAQLGPIEREAYLTSLTKQAEIVTAPIKTTVDGIDVDNRKSAKKGIKELLKRGKIAQGKNDYIKAVELYDSAAILASNWELHDDYGKIEETIRKTKIEDLMEKKTKLEKEAKDAVKGKIYAEAAAKYKYASKMASEIFKLGDTSMTKEVKRLTNKSNEYEKLK